MCGIAGLWSINGVNESTLQSMSSCLIHRGPDSGGNFLNKIVGLGHRRLSILDLSSVADQPMKSANGRYLMVYNGEVYNYREINKELNLADTVPLKTTSDTEVILETFSKKGTETFTLLNGMFALAIYDQFEEVLFLARDQIGIKPLFYYWDKKDFYFASELKSLRNLPGVELELNKTAIPYFLHLGYIPEPYTIYKNVYKFPSGSFLKIDKHTKDLEFKYFWRLEDKVEKQPIKDEKEAKLKLKSLLFDAVEKQLVSDVPIGTFLSGGIDSSIVTAVASKVSQKKVQTFSIGFADSKHDESVYAQGVATFLRTDHFKYEVKEKDAIDLVPHFLNVYDEPFADSSAFPTMLVSKLARKNVTVTLSGDGGDELFLGYGMYKWAERLNNPILKAFSNPINLFLKQLGNRNKRAATLFDYKKYTHIKSHVFSQEQYLFNEYELETIGNKFDFDFDILNDDLKPNRMLTSPERQSFWDINHYLKDDLLVKVDRASMYYSLETRVPLLDTRIVEFALNLDPALKNKNNISKYLLKEVLYEMVPKELFDRPKRGFSVPLARWLKGDLRFLVEEYTNNTIIQKHGLLNNLEVQKLKKRFFGNEEYLYNRIWVVTLLHWWLEKNID